MNYGLAYSLTRAKWAIDLQYAQANLAMVAGILDGKINIVANEEKILPTVFAKDAQTSSFKMYSWTDLDSVPYGSVGVVRIIGSLTKYDQECGPVGMATIGERIKRLDNHNNIAAIVLHIDSPGGTVDGTDYLAQIVKNSSKPVVVWVDGLMASAALWIGVHADEIYAADDYSEVGSIGVMMSFFDIIPYYEKEGLNYHQIVSKYSEEKSKLFDEVRAGKYENYRELQLDPLALKFREVVSDRRPLVKEQHLNGAVFFAKDVMKVFVDAIGSLEDAIERAAKLATTNNKKQQTTNNVIASEARSLSVVEVKQPQTLNNQSSNPDKMKDYPQLATLISEFEIDAENSATFSADVLASIEAAIVSGNAAAAKVTELEAAATATETQHQSAIADLNQQVSNAQTERDSAITERDAHANTITERDNTIAERDATIVDLQARVPGATSAPDARTTEVADAKLSEEKEQEKLASMSITERVAYLKEQDKKS